MDPKDCVREKFFSRLFFSDKRQSEKVDEKLLTFWRAFKFAKPQKLCIHRRLHTPIYHARKIV